MARTTQDMRDSKGRYIKLTLLSKFRNFCNVIGAKIDKWIDSLDK